MSQLPVVLIPSLQPDERLVTYVKELKTAGFEDIVVVDDGSGREYRAVFDRVEEAGCTVLHHLVNRGKGAALKLGYDWIGEHLPDCMGVLTADSDGQHTVADCLKVSEALHTGENALYLGSRDFSLPHVPPKSRFGNRCTSTVFKWLYGVWLPDTQTGLRAFRREELPFMAAVSGARYEYEMTVLIECARRKLPMVPITIETVYEDGNEGTHFHPIRDSWRIYKVILGNFFKFIASSLSCFILDQGIAALLRDMLLPAMGMNTVERIFVSGYGARLCSSIVNYLINRNVVFREKGDGKRSALRYFLLCVLIICLSNLGVYLLDSIGMAPALAKILCDLLLYFLSYQVQNRWVFAEKEQ